MFKQQLFYLNVKTRAAFKKMLSEERGASGVIEMVVIIGIVVVLAFLFREAIFNLFKSLWEGVVKTPVETKGESTGQISVSSITLPD